jgi:hypothetical protein
MKRIFLIAMIGALAALGGGASAQSFGVYVGTDHPYRHHHHRWRGDYAYEPGCRVIVTHRDNRWGERVTVRRRVCD